MLKVDRKITLTNKKAIVVAIIIREGEKTAGEKIQ